MKRRILICSTTILSVWSACGPSHEDVLERFRPAYAVKREQLTRIATILPPVGRFKPLEAGKLDPGFTLVERGDTNTADALMFEQLTEPEKRVPLDLYLSDSLATALAWTAEAKRAFPGGDPDFMERVLKAGIQLRYLVVHRTSELELARAIDVHTYTPGRIAIEGFVVDLEKESVVASYRISAEVPPRVEYSYREGQSAELRLEEFARSAIWTQCRQQIKEELKRVTGGVVEFD